MQSRDQMHAEEVGSEEDSTDAETTDQPLTDSARMFQMGLDGGKPESGDRGTAPEWFYKGNGVCLRGHRETLDIPSFALDGGEEPEFVGCYVIGPCGTPFRLGFALGNEWSTRIRSTPAVDMGKLNGAFQTTADHRRAVHVSANRSVCGQGAGASRNNTHLVGRESALESGCPRIT